MSPHHSGHREPTVDVWKEFGSTVEVLVDDVAGQGCSVDRKEHEVGSAAEIDISHSRELVSIRAVNEPIRVEALWHILA